jgi:hypothetical protein
MRTRKTRAFEPVAQEQDRRQHLPTTDWDLEQGMKIWLQKEIDAIEKTGKRNDRTELLGGCARTQQKTDDFCLGGGDLAAIDDPKSKTELCTPCRLGAGDGKQAGEKFCRRALLDKNRSETPKKIKRYTPALGGTEREQESRRRSELENTANRTTQWELTTGTSAA